MHAPGGWPASSPLCWCWSLPDWVEAAKVRPERFSLVRRLDSATPLQTAVTKTFVTEVGGGALALLADWSIYVLIASAVIGFVLQQSALKTGVLAPAMASSNAVSLFGGVLLGGLVYGETLGHGNHRLAPAIIGLAAAVVGIVLLARAQGPSSTEPTTGRGTTSPVPTS